MASVLITGASKGIGRATAAEFARRGHRVVATARDPRSLTGLDVDQRLPLDVTDPASVAAAVEAAGEIDVLVSNAGVIFYAAVEAIPPDKFAEIFDLNTVGALRVAQAVLPGMRARGHGRLLFMSSVAGRIVLAAGRCLRRDQVGPRGIWWKGLRSKWPRSGSKPRCWSRVRSARGRWTT